MRIQRKKAERRVIKSEFLNIKGIGPKATELLFKKFKSVKTIRNASFDELSECVGKAKALLLQRYLDKYKE